MNSQMSHLRWTAVTLVVAWGVIGLAANLAQTRIAPSMVWFWASLASVAVTWAVTCFRKAAR